MENDSIFMRKKKEEIEKNKNHYHFCNGKSLRKKNLWKLSNLDRITQKKILLFFLPDLMMENKQTNKQTMKILFSL